MPSPRSRCEPIDEPVTVTSMRLVLACALLLISANVPAEVYKWKDENGVIHYGDKPLSPNAKPVTLPQLQILNSLNKKSPSSSFKGGPAPYGGAGPHVEITEPAPDATLRADGKFSVQVDIRPA